MYNQPANGANDNEIKLPGAILLINRHVSCYISRQWLPSVVSFIGLWARTAVHMPQIVVHTFESGLELFSNVVEPLK